MASLIAIFAFAALGLLLWRIAPHSEPSAVASLTDQILVAKPSDIQPKPESQFVYLALIVATPAVVLLVAGLCGRWKDDGPGAGDIAVLLAALGLIALNIHADPVAAGRGGSSALYGGAFLIAMAIGAMEIRLPARFREAIRRIVFGVLCLMALIIVFSLWPFSASSLGERRSASPEHFGAFLYSIVQIAHGGVCTVDVQTQYGCYGELYWPVVKLIGSSVTRLSILTAALLAVAMISVLWTCQKLIRSPLLLFGCGCALLFIQTRVVAGGADPYYQYDPLRFFFPALSLPLAWWWCGRPSVLRTALCAGFGATAVMANTDSGVVVLGALGLLAGAAWAEARVKAVLSYAAVGGGVLLAFWIIFSLAGGRPADFALLFRYERIFAGAGFFMLPTPPPPAAWVAAAGAAIVGLTLAALAAFRKQAGPREFMIGYLAVLGVGLLSYYMGRSHPLVLVLCVWPLLVLLFVLLDCGWEPASGAAKVHAIVARGAVGPPCLMALLTCMTAGPILLRDAESRWSDLLHPDPQRQVLRNIDFIRSSAGGQGFEILSKNQAVILAETGARSHLPGPESTSSC